MATTTPVPRIAPLDGKEWQAVIPQLPAFAQPDPTGKRPPFALVTTLSRHPKLLSAWLNFAAQLLGGKLPAREREILVLRTLWLCQGSYEWGPHARVARKAGLTDADFDHIIAGPEAAEIDSFDAVLIRAADELHQDACLSESTWSALAVRFDEQQLIEVTMVVGQYHVAAFTLNSIGLADEPGTETMPGPAHSG
jgi:4-carboxymuconolactone decarboxylase